MKIGFCYDTKKDYGYEEDNLEYTDFVSLSTISEIGKAIEQNGYILEYIGNIEILKDQLANKSFNCDLVFNISEGFGSRNREALVPCLLEIYGIPCTASDAYGMTINLNKHHAKILVKSIGVPVPKDIYFEKIDEQLLKQISCLKYPFILKPNYEGGSMGLFLINSQKEFIEKASYLINKYSYPLLAEEYIAGTEITVPIVGNGSETKALGVISTLNEDGTNIPLYDNTLKYEDNVINTTTFNYSDDIRKKLIDYSEQIHKFFKLNDYSRMDFRLNPNGDIYFLEINTMPSLCRNGSFEQCGKELGLEYHEVIGAIISSARKRYNL